jgi:hypothetical protein
MTFETEFKSVIADFVPISEDRYDRLLAENRGMCLGCHHEQEGVEPDARELTCNECHDDFVFGAEELMLMGLITVDGEDTDDEE